ncbi:sialate O-acetylesterase isoform X7 [Pogoniulus pusillus]|uniref:sialate O-acetylesterase isoform X7 n=1 Tax=Pogoniulus pusillus TaxID=488313 RepID=UPI0030B99D2E
MAAWVLLALAPVAAGALLGFASYYGDHMVLQKEPAGAVVWGYGEPGATVTLALSREGGIVVMKKLVTVKGPSGTWTAVLEPMAQGGPYELTAAQGLQNATLQDVYFGDVWLCSGQSNMAMTVLQIANASRELAAAARYPHVRLFAAAPARSDVELQDLERIDLPWAVPTAANLGHGNFTYFSAVCWLLGRALYDARRYPVGLVQAAWPGTPIEAWSSRRALRACGLLEDTGSQLPSGPQAPSVLWNAMVHPLLRMALRGLAWYQGEANVLLHREQYSCSFPALIADWRRTAHAASAGQSLPLLPFGFVQHPPPGQADRGPAAAAGCQGGGVRGAVPRVPGAVPGPCHPGGDQGAAERHLQPGAALAAEGRGRLRGSLLQPARVGASAGGGSGVPHGDTGPGRLRAAGAGLALRLGRVAL